MMQGFIFVTLLVFTTVCRADAPVIAVASNLTQPMNRIIEIYTTETGITPRASFGSSGNFARQIVQGAPYEMFISASYEYVDFLLSQEAIDHQGDKLVQGQIGFFIHHQSILGDYNDLDSIINALSYREYRKIAFANPEHAPYGVAASQALQAAGLWAIEKNRVLLADNVAQVMQFALSGNVDLAVIPYSFMQQDRLREHGVYYPVPDDWYTPVIQYVVLTRKASQATRDFRAFLYSDAAREIFEEYGYSYMDE